MDLCLRYQSVTLGIELKVCRETGHFPQRGEPPHGSVLKKRDPQNHGIEQLESYLARLGLDEGWLFIFDRRKNALPIEETVINRSCED